MPTRIPSHAAVGFFSTPRSGQLLTGGSPRPGRRECRQSWSRTDSRRTLGKMQSSQTTPRMRKLRTTSLGHAHFTMLPASKRIRVTVGTNGTSAAATPRPLHHRRSGRQSCSSSSGWLDSCIRRPSLHDRAFFAHRATPVAAGTQSHFRGGRYTEPLPRQQVPEPPPRQQVHRATSEAASTQSHFH